MFVKKIHGNVEKRFKKQTCVNWVPFSEIKVKGQFQDQNRNPNVLIASSS